MRISLRSIAFSWLFALGLLGLLLLLGAPRVVNTATASAVIDLPAHLMPAGSESLTSLQSTVWCALESRQTARIQQGSRDIQFPGAMAIAPEWRGAALPESQQARLDQCVQKRMQQLAIPASGSQRAALTFLFDRNPS